MNAGKLYIEVRKRSGSVRKRYAQHIHSYTMNQLKQWANRSGAVNDIQTVAGGTQNTSNWYFGTSSHHERGLVVGTDNTASTFLDTQLGAIVGHGTGAGQLEYGLQTTSRDKVNGIVTAAVERLYTNNSGAEITVREIGIYASTSAVATSNAFVALMLRDVLDTPVAIPNGETLYVRIDFDINSGADVLLNGNGGSWFFAPLQVNLSGIEPTVLRTGSTNTNIPNFALQGAAGAAGGIHLGTSDAVFDKDASNQFTLVSEIQHGTGAGQLSHGANSISLVNSSRRSFQSY